MKLVRLNQIPMSVDQLAPNEGVNGVGMPEGTLRPLRGILTLTVPSGVTLFVILWGYLNGIWGRLCDPGNPEAKLGGPSTDPIVAGTYHFELDHLESIDRLALVQSNKTGADVVTAALSLFEERP